MKTISNMSASRVFCFIFLAVVSMSHTVIALELTNVTTRQYLVTRFKAEHLSYQWTIENFTLLPEKTECYNSSDFHTEHHDVGWKVSFCPKLHDDIGDYASVNLYPYTLGGPDKIIKVDGELHIFKSGDIIDHDIFRGKKLGRGEQTQNPWSGHWEYPENHHNVRLPEIADISDSTDNITIRWEIDMPLKSITEMINVTEQKNLRDSQKGHLNEDFGRLLKEKKFSDVEIIVGDQKLSAHKIILATRSPEFAELFENAEINDIGKSQVTVDNMEPAVMTAVLEYLYTDDVANLDEFPSMFALLSAAHDFKLPHLKTMCEEVLHRKLAADNAADILVFTDRYGLNQLKKRAMEFIRNHFPDVMETEGYKKMKDKSPALLMEILFSATDKRF